MIAAEDSTRRLLLGVYCAKWESKVSPKLLNPLLYSPCITQWLSRRGFDG